MKSNIGHLESQPVQAATLKQGGKAIVKHTGQIVELKRVSEHGISIVSFHTGGDYFMLNNSLEPATVYN